MGPIKQKLSRTQKNKKDKQWYKDNADYLDTLHFGSNLNFSFWKKQDKLRMKINYDLYNNILNEEDFRYVCKPLGEGLGELPARMVNRDIISPKVKAVLGMEKKMPFLWRAIAVNPEATTQREQEYFGQIMAMVQQKIMEPIKQQLMQQKAEQDPEYAKALQGAQENPEGIDEQTAALLEKASQEIDSQAMQMTPDELRVYFERKYQLPVEVLANQLLKFLLVKLNFYDLKNEAFKHGCISGVECLYSGVINNEPVVKLINPMRLCFDVSAETGCIEDGERASYEYRLSASQVVEYFGGELSDEEIDRVYECTGASSEDAFDSFVDENYEENINTISVIHCVWKGLRKIGFLWYLDPETGNMQQTIVDEVYKVEKEAGDVVVEWRWYPEVYETWKIRTAEPIYVRMQPLPGQFKDINNLFYCKLPYYGIVHDAINSQSQSLVDRLKSYQYWYNIIMYRLELLLAADKGKKVLMDINAVPNSSGIDQKQFQYYMEALGMMWINPNEEGNQPGDLNNVARVLDLSTASDMQRYISLAEYVRQQAGRAVGIPDAIEGQIAKDAALGNTQITIEQSSNIVSVLISKHEEFIEKVLQSLIENAKVCYKNNESIGFVLDDLSQQTLNVDSDLLLNSTFGVFVRRSIEKFELKQMYQQLAHASLQTGQANLSDILAVLNLDDPQEIREHLKAAEQKKAEQLQQQQQAEQQAAMEQLEKQREIALELEDLQTENKKEIIKVQEREKRKTFVVSNIALGASYNPDVDKNKDGVNDFVQTAWHMLQELEAQQNMTIESGDVAPEGTPELFGKGKKVTKKMVEDLATQ